ncbi:sporulation protein [Streptomyces sp. A7024]|uniref:Sporulation protein n=1 Tax=Streptomyces coryli TaxID=1128680 RepID=A0A6G4UEW4_9ACTN|nr:spore germination protein GerW family protein [Streptomyces coryli]NGN70247.1 sporulation protein [Streptomyces coryli]
MTDAPVRQAPTGESAANAAASLLERLAERIGGRASVTAVFGEPVTRGEVTVIPVARIGFGFGGGAGREIGTAKTGEGGGGGGGAEARPLGFIEIRNGLATYKPIRDPWADVVIPLAGVVLGTSLPKIMRRLLKRRKN